MDCPICQNRFGGECRISHSGADRTEFSCDVCGTFILSGSVHGGALDPDKNKLTDLQKAALSHKVRQSFSESNQPRYIDSTWLTKFLIDTRLPTPPIQAINAIRFIGTHIQSTGDTMTSLPLGFHAIIGAPNPPFAQKLLLELIDRKWCAAKIRRDPNGRPAISSIGLTLDGWDRYEAEKSGQLAGRYGFIAMQFHDDVLDSLINNVVKPFILAQLDFALVDMRDVAAPGLIDNIMRVTIRDAAFVFVDLTHDNSGAYWEAGYAEGLGKPVLYLCEKSKFEEKGTHFDTNHLTTVIWSPDDPDQFKNELVATIRRAINLFPTA